MVDRPLRILLVLRAPIGGLFRHVFDLTRSLAARGHELGIVTDNLRSDAQTQVKLDLLRPITPLGIHSFPIPREVGAGDLTTPFQVRALAERLKVDVVHGHGAKGGVHARFARLGKSGRVALYTPHGGVLNYRPGSAVGGFFRGVERLILPLTDAIVFESAFAREAYIHTIAEPACPHPIIHNGLAESEFEPIPLAPDARDFVFIGEFRPVKGIFVLLDALAGLHAPDGRPASLIMAGDGPDRPQVEARIAKPDLAGRVTLAGVQPARTMLALGRCQLVPSLAESLPYVILEGASAGRPVISTDVGGIREIYGPTGSSLLPAGDVPALARAMQAALDDPAAAQREADERLTFIRTRFSIDVMTNAIEALYRQVLKQR